MNRIQALELARWCAAQHLGHEEASTLEPMTWVLDAIRAAAAGGVRHPTWEVLFWHEAKTSRPDSDLSVVCWAEDGFFDGYWDDGLGQWIACESGGIVLGVTHWAEPHGPVAG